MVVNLRLYSGKYNQFTSNYNSRAVIYEHKMFLRLATGHTAPTTQLNLHCYKWANIKK